MNPVSISGRIEAGSLQVGDNIVAIPSGESGIIKAIEVDEEPTDWAVAGHNVVIHLSNIDMVHLRYNHNTFKCLYEHVMTSFIGRVIFSAIQQIVLLPKVHSR
jgi:translation elongation factor EF-1alpha